MASIRRPTANESSNPLIIEAPVVDRISQLTQKLTTMHLHPSPSMAANKYNEIDNSCEELESQMEEFKNFV